MSFGYDARTEPLVPGFAGGRCELIAAMQQLAAGGVTSRLNEKRTYCPGIRVLCRHAAEGSVFPLLGRESRGAVAFAFSSAAWQAQVRANVIEHLQPQLKLCVLHG